MSYKADYLLWGDIETTGLHPEQGQILEIALVLTDAAYNELDSLVLVLALDGPIGLLDPYVLNMHLKSGLWAACAVSALTKERAAQMIRSWKRELASKFDLDWSKMPFAGSNPRFDADWLREGGFPCVRDGLHYRLFDASTLAIAYENVLGEMMPRGEVAHRAMPDLRYSISVAKKMRDVLVHYLNTV